MPVPDHVRQFVRGKFGSRFKSRTRPTTGNPFRDATIEEDETRQEDKTARRSEREERGLDLRGGR